MLSASLQDKRLHSIRLSHLIEKVYVHSRYKLLDLFLILEQIQYNFKQIYINNITDFL